MVPALHLLLLFQWWWCCSLVLVDHPLTNNITSMAKNFHLFTDRDAGQLDTTNSCASNITNTHWDICVLCQRVTNEKLLYPHKVKGVKVSGYNILADNMQQFHKLGRMPLAIDISRLDDGSGICETLKSNHACWHRSCYLLFCTMKLKRAIDGCEKRKAHTHLDNPSPVKTRSQLGILCDSAEVSDTKTCFFCDHIDTNNENECLHRAATKGMTKNVTACATALRDSKILTKLAPGDMIASNAVYHLPCHRELRNRFRSHNREVNKEQDNSDSIDALVLGELIGYIEETRLNEAIVPVFKLAELVKMYMRRLTELESQDTEGGRVHSTRLKERLLQHVPGLRAETQGRDVLLLFEQDIGCAIKQVITSNTDSDAVHLVRAAQVVRRDIFEKEYEFSGSFEPNCERDAAPRSLNALVRMILEGPNIENLSQANSTKKRISLSLSQLIMFNTVKKSYQSDSTRHCKEREAPLPIYLSMLIHAKTRKRELIDTFYDLGLCVSYHRLLTISTNMANTVCERYNQEDIVCPPRLNKNVFTCSAIDNIDHNPSAMEAHDSFHGTAISLMQFPTTEATGADIGNIVIDTAVINQKKIAPLPVSYTVVPPVDKRQDPIVPTRQGNNSVDVNILTKDMAKEHDWLSHMNTMFHKEALSVDDNMSWAAYHASQQPPMETALTKTALLPLFREAAHSTSMILHAIHVISTAVRHLNPRQIPVVAVDQPLYAIAKQVQWSWPESHGEDKVVVMMGGLHLEMNWLKLLGDWLEGSGWTSSLVQADVTTAGRADAMLTGAHVTRTRMTEQLIPIGDVDESDMLGFTLHNAAIHGNKKALKKVLDKGIFIDYPNDEGQSPLFCACYASKENVVEYLLSAGANPNEKSNSGLTPVHAACFAGDVKILVRLLHEGGDLRLHDHQGRSVKDWAILQPRPKKRMKTLEFLDKARLFAMSSSGQDLLMNKASSTTMHRAHRRKNTITKIIRDKIGHGSVHQNLEHMANTHHSLGFGQVYANGSKGTGFLSAIPMVSENSLRHDTEGETYNNGAFAVMESMWWDYTEVTVKRLHRDIDAFHGGVVDLFINEIEHLGKLRHPHTLTLMGVCQTSNLDGLILIYERVGQGSLYNLLHQKMERLPTETIQDIAVQMCNAVVFIHLRGLVHCAITSHAISVVNQHIFKIGNFEYMVESSKCDLGKKNAVSTNTSEHAVYNWLAPEVIFDMPPTFYCDMYSYCAVLWEIFTGDVPWDSHCTESIKAQYGKGNKLPVARGKMAEFYRVILDYGLELDPNDRKLSFLHVRDLLLAAPKDAKYYLKTHFQHLRQNDNVSNNQRSALRPMMSPNVPPPRPASPTQPHTSSQSAQQGSSQEVAPSAPDMEHLPKSQLESHAFPPPRKSTVDKVSEHQRKKRREKNKRKVVKEEDYQTEAIAGELDRRQKVSAERDLEQRWNHMCMDRGHPEKRQGAPNVDDYDATRADNLTGESARSRDTSPRKPARHCQYQTTDLNWELMPEEMGDEFLYTVQVKRHPSPTRRSSAPGSPGKAFVRDEVETQRKCPFTPPKKQMVEVTSTEESADDTTEEMTGDITENNGGKSSGSSSHSSRYAKGRELCRKTSSMGAFSYLHIQQAPGGNHARTHSAGAKPANHGQYQPVEEEYSTRGKLTTAGSLYAMYNDHETDLPMGQLAHRHEHPAYVTLPRAKAPASPLVHADNNWFGGKGSVRDLAQIFQQQMQEHSYFQSVLEGKASTEEIHKHNSDTGHSTGIYPSLGKAAGQDYANHANGRVGKTTVKRSDDQDSCCSLTTVSESEAGTGDEDKQRQLFDLDTDDSTSTFATDVDDKGQKAAMSTSTESDIVSKWVDHELKKIKRNVSRDLAIKASQQSMKSPELFGFSPPLFDTSNHDVTPPSNTERNNHKNTDTNDSPETGDHIKHPVTEEFYFDDELYAAEKLAKQGDQTKALRLYFSDEASPTDHYTDTGTEVVAQQPVRHVRKKHNCCKEPEQTDMKSKDSRRSKIPMVKSKTASKTKSLEGVYANIVTVKSSLDDAGVHKVTHKMKNLKTGGTKMLVNDSVKAKKVTTTFKAAR